MKVVVAVAVVAGATAGRRGACHRSEAGGTLISRVTTEYVPPTRTRDGARACCLLVGYKECLAVVDILRASSYVLVRRYIVVFAVGVQEPRSTLIYHL